MLLKDRCNCPLVNSGILLLAIRKKSIFCWYWVSVSCMCIELSTIEDHSGMVTRNDARPNAFAPAKYSGTLRAPKWVHCLFPLVLGKCKCHKIVSFLVSKKSANLLCKS